MTDNTESDDKFSPERIRRRLPEELTEAQMEGLTAVIRNPNANGGQIERLCGHRSTNIRSVMHALISGNYGMGKHDGLTQVAERRDGKRKAKTFEELTDKQQAAFEFVAANYDWCHDENTTLQEVADAIADEHGETVHETYWKDVTENKYPELFAEFRQQVEASDDTPDVERMGWGELVDAIPFETADENLDEIPDPKPTTEPENSPKRRAFAANGASTDEATEADTPTTMNATTESDDGDDVALEITDDDEAQLNDGIRTSVPDAVRDDGGNAVERAGALIHDLDKRISFVEGLDEPGKAALRMQDYFEVVRSVVKSLCDRIEESEQVTKELRKRAQTAEGKHGELKRVTQTQANRIDELRDIVLEAEADVEELATENQRLEDANGHLIERENRLEERHDTHCERIDELETFRDEAAERVKNQADYIRELQEKLKNAGQGDSPLANVDDGELRTLLLMVGEFADTREVTGYDIAHGDGSGARVIIGFSERDGEGDDQ